MKSLLRWTAASLAAVFLVSAPQKSQAQVFLGNGTAVWSDTANWAGGVAPSGTTAITFAEGPTNLASTNDIVGLTVLGINFTNGGVADNSVAANNSSFTLNGNKIILGGNIAGSAVAHTVLGDGTGTNNRIIRDVINLNMDLDGSRTFTMNSVGTNNRTQTQHHLTVNGAIGETAPGVGVLNKAGAGILSLNGTNTFTGGIQVTGGVVQFSNQANNLGTNVLRSSNGSFQYIPTAEGNLTLTSNITLYNTGNQGATLLADGPAGGNSTLTYAGTLSTTDGNGTTKTVTLSGGNTGNNTFSSVITNGFNGTTTIPVALTKAGNGRWIVGDSNSYSGVTALNAGTLRVTSLDDNFVAANASSLGTNSTINFAGGQLQYLGAGNTSLVIANRTISLPGTNNQSATILNDSALTNNTIVFNGAFTVPAGSGAKTLTLSGSNTGANIWNSTIANSGVGTGTTAIVKAGAGQWIVTSNNTYSGVPATNAGTLTVLTIDDTIATPQPLGVSGNTTFNGGALNYAGVAPLAISSNRTFTLVGSGQFNNNAVTGGNQVVFNGNLNGITGTANNNNTRTLTLGGGNLDANRFNTVIADVAPNGTFRKPVNLQKANGGIWEVTGNNTYTGFTLLTQGTLSVTSIGNLGVPGNLGTGTEVGNATGNTGGNATIRLGNGNTSGNLRYTGTGDSSNRLFQIGQATGNAVAPGNQGGGGAIINNGTGALSFTNGIFNESVTANAGAAGRALTLQGNFAGVNTIAGTIQDNILIGNGTAGGQQVRVIKSQATTWALNGANTYSGNTTVNGGTLLINGSTAGGDVIVNAAGTLGGSGTIGGNITISGNLSPGNSPGLMIASQNLSLGVNSTFTWELTGNTNAGRGTNFDGVDVGGTLAIDPTVSSVLNTSGGLNTSDSFWTANRSWLVFDTTANNYAGAVPTVLSGSLVTAFPGAFSYGVAGGDVFLNFTAVPEPSSLLLTVLGVAGFGLRRSRKNRS